MEAARSRGAELLHGDATGLVRSPTGDRVTGVQIEGDIIEGDAVVIAMGPWSILASQWLSLPAVYGSKGHSLVYETGDRLPAEALFLEANEDSGELHSPEIFPRPDGTTWACAISSSSPLPFDPADVAPDPGAMERLHGLCSRLSPVLAESKVLARQACFRPVTQDGLPLIGQIPDLAGAFVATGHSV
jgi:glycine/D-amino acid oxidase-like deaminating enzyme